MATFGSERCQDEFRLVARILLSLLFLIFGWAKLTDYTGTVASMAQHGLPLPSIAALIAFLRPEEKFDGLEAMTAQVMQDARIARELLTR